jgi:serine/threonine protein kinase
MGEVFAAVDQSTGARIALKRMLVPESKHAKQRSPVVNFMREYHALTELRHPRIIAVYDYGVDRARPYYTMELLDGHDLRELSPVPFREACGYLRDVASSLALLHARRLLHRDISPRNVRRTSDGRCKLLDFGAMVPFGVPPNLTGTPSFIAPEALQSARTCTRSARSLTSC